MDNVDNLEKFMPCLRRHDIYLKFNQVEIKNTNIVFNIETKILTFLVNCKDLKLTEVNISLKHTHEDFKTR